MEEVLISLIDSLRDNALAITGIADQFAALKAALLKHHPEMKDDFDAQLAVEKDGSRDYVSLCKSSFHNCERSSRARLLEGSLKLSRHGMLE